MPMAKAAKNFMAKLRLEKQRNQTRGFIIKMVNCKMAN